jgi:serine/threonine protein kinase
MVKNDNIFIFTWKKLKKVLLPSREKNVKPCIDIVPITHLENYYQLDRVIGRGEFSKVRLAYCLLTGRKVAIKFIPIPSFANGGNNDSNGIINLDSNKNTNKTIFIDINEEEDRKWKENGRFQRVPSIDREMEIIKEINHPNIIKLHGIFRLPDSLALVMQLAEGGELFEYVKLKRQLPEGESKKFMRQICNGN